MRAMAHGGLRPTYEDHQMAIVIKPAGVHTKPYRGMASFEDALPAFLEPPPEMFADRLSRPLAVNESPSKGTARHRANPTLSARLASGSACWTLLCTLCGCDR